MIIKKANISNLDDAVKLLKTTSCDNYVYDKLSKKMIENTIIVDDIDNRAANILKQEAISCGADVAVSKDVSMFKQGITRAIICANFSQTEKLINKIKEQPFELKILAQEIKKLNDKKNYTIVCAKKKIKINKKLVMGIVNLSPDSFYGNGVEASIAANIALDMQENGADIIDVGAESTRPGSKPVPVKEEIKRVRDFLKLFAKKSKIPISIDTYKPEVANVALNEGADIINDIYALRYDNSKMAKTVAKHKAAVVLMHMQGTPTTMQKNIKYKEADIMAEIFNFLKERIDFSLNNGIKKESIIIDPGIGFGKTVEHNLLIIKKMIELKSLDCPILIGISNKSFLADVANVKELKDRLIASTTACICAAQNGADIIRVHNIKETIQALKVINAIRNV